MWLVRLHTYIPLGGANIFALLALNSSSFKFFCSASCIKRGFLDACSAATLAALVSSFSTRVSIPKSIPSALDKTLVFTNRRVILHDTRYLIVLKHAYGDLPLACKPCLVFFVEIPQRLSPTN